MDVEKVKIYDDESNTNRAWFIRYPLILMNFVIDVVLPIILIVLLIGLLPLLITVVLQESPMIKLEYVSVSLHNVSNDSQQQQMMMSEWSLAFSVTSTSFGSTTAFQYINVSIHDHLTGNSMVTTIPPFHKQWTDDDETNYLHAFVHAPLPSLNATNIELSFDVEVQTLVKYKNWLNIHPREFNKATCKDMKVSMLSSTVYGNLRGAPYTCVDEDRWWSR